MIYKFVMAPGRLMGLRHYTLTVKTSHKSATAFSLNARCDEDAVGKAMMVLKRLDAFCHQPRFQMVRADGTIVHGIERQA